MNPLASNTSTLDRDTAGLEICCVWCGMEQVDRGPSTRCTGCGLFTCPGEDPTKGGVVDPERARTSARNRVGGARSSRLSVVPGGCPVLGIDPGARYVGVVVRDGDVVVHSSTLVRPGSGSMWAGDLWAWARQVPVLVAEIAGDFQLAGVAVEGLAAPKGFKSGQRASLNPEHVIAVGVVLGALLVAFPMAVVVPPGGNGSGHYLNYPGCLLGRRPKGLPGDGGGARTRAHEQSAFDVAGRGGQILRDLVRGGGGGGGRLGVLGFDTDISLCGAVNGF